MRAEMLGRSRGACEANGLGVALDLGSRYRGPQEMNEFHAAVFDRKTATERLRAGSRVGGRVLECWGEIAILERR